jgi:hypothetical protein
MIELKEVKGVERILEKVDILLELGGDLKIFPLEIYIIDSRGVIRKLSDGQWTSAKPYFIIKRVEFVGDGGRKNIFVLVYEHGYLEEAIHLLDKVLEDNL